MTGNRHNRLGLYARIRQVRGSAMPEISAIFCSFTPKSLYIETVRSWSSFFPKNGTNIFEIRWDRSRKDTSVLPPQSPCTRQPIGQWSLGFLHRPIRHGSRQKLRADHSLLLFGYSLVSATHLSPFELYAFYASGKGKRLPIIDNVKFHIVTVFSFCESHTLRLL